LLDGGAAVDARNRNGNTALMLAAWKGHGEVVVALLKAGADHYLRNKQKLAARELAVEAGHAEVAQVFERHGDGKKNWWKLISG